MKRFPPRRILVAADLSAPSRSALAAAKSLARRWEASLEIVYVRQPPMAAAWIGPEGMPVIMPPMEESGHAVEKKLREIAADLPPRRLKLRTLSGWAPAALLELARPERADLMVMGTHGYAGLDRVLTGSIAEAALRRARIPVLVVPEGAAVDGIKRVLAPWNGRPYATRALRWAREAARGFGAELRVFHVEEGGGSPDGHRALERQLVSLLGCGADWRLRSRKGEARAQIIKEAGSGRCGLVVLSAHRRRFGADFALGSTVERALRHCSIPVLAIPSGPMRPPLLRRLASRVAARLG